MNRTRVLLTVAAFLFFAASSAIAQVGPQVLNPVGGSSCLDVDGNWTANCYEDGGLSGTDQCSKYAASCATACSSQEASTYNSCAKISDPVQQGNCYVYAQMDWQECQNQCDQNVALGICF